MSGIIIYQKPTCSTCREAVKILTDRGVPFTAINYYATPLTKAKLKGLLRKAGLSPREILRTKEAMYKKLGLGKKQMSDEQLIDLMLRHPDLIQRPLVERGPRAILARPADSVTELL